MNLKTEKQASGPIAKMLSIIEKVGNMLPHPATLFALLAFLVVFASWLFSLADIRVIHPGTGLEVVPVNLMSVEGFHKILEMMIKNFTDFAPLGTVLVSLLGIGVAEGSGLIGTSLRLLVIKAPRNMLTFVIVLAGVLSNAASEVGYVVLVPLSAMIFLAIGRNPIAGLAAAFAGVSGGYSANLLLGTIDPLLAGISEEAARIIEPGYHVNPACNYYFMFVSTFLIAGLGTWVTEKIVVPRLGEYKGSEKPELIKEITGDEKKGLWYASIVSVLLVIIILIGIIPDGGFLRDVATGSILKSPFLKGIVAFIFLASALAGIAYGIGAKTIKSDSDVMDGMAKSMQTLGSYIVLVFFAAQFVAYFNWTNIGIIVAVKGAETLKSSGFGPIPLMLSFVFVSAIINMFMGSASAKWAIMAPVFIPMFMLLGYSPEYVQVAYRIGDSVTNIISPMMSYFALIIAFVQRYDKEAGIGTLIATMIPYSIVFLIGWIILFTTWILLALPVGPGAGMLLTP
jgi:aminobenzoyl-glutamate transport protein